MSEVELIGQRIKRERLKKGMTQRDLAVLVRVGVPHISKIEAGRENPSDDLLQKIADVFHCDVDELLLVAKRIAPHLMEELATDPVRSLEYLRRWKARDD